MQYGMSIAQMTEDSYSGNPPFEQLKGKSNTVVLPFYLCSGSKSVVFEGQTHVNVLEGSQGIG